MTAAPGAPEAPFEEPWQAQAFAMAVALNEAGVFAWADWAEALGRRRAEAAARGEDDYWACWLAALEDVVEAEAGIPREAVAETAAAWRRAAEATPHGTPITLEILGPRAGSAAGPEGAMSGPRSPSGGVNAS